MWRAIIARQHDIVYGKFFDKKAGFISKKWLPVFANYRRDGYDYVTSCYKDNSQDSWKLLVDYMHEMYPEATDKQIMKLLK